MKDKHRSFRPTSNRTLYARFNASKGFDIPEAADFSNKKAPRHE
jgi:hypothetical protein